MVCIFILGKTRRSNNGKINNRFRGEEGGSQSVGKEKFLKILDDIKLQYVACNIGNFEVIE